jgi:hypothetical protein
MTPRASIHLHEPPPQRVQSRQAAEHCVVIGNAQRRQRFGQFAAAAARGTFASNRDREVRAAARC